MASHCPDFVVVPVVEMLDEGATERRRRADAWRSKTGPLLRLTLFRFESEGRPGMFAVEIYAAVLVCFCSAVDIVMLYHDHRPRHILAKKSNGSMTGAMVEASRRGASVRSQKAPFRVQDSWPVCSDQERAVVQNSAFPPRRRWRR